MNRQRHVIKRQTVEISIDKNMDAWVLQQRISRMVSAQIVPLIDRYCGEMSSPDQIHRIEQLELDLGKLDPNNFETDFAGKFAEALHRGLAEQIKRLESDARFQHSSSTIDSHLELFSLFVRQGILPWWADLQQPKLPENSLDYLLREAPDALRRLFSELVRDNHALQRLVRYFDDASLLALFELALPTLVDFPVLLCRALMAVSDNMAQSFSLSPSYCRAQLWQAILQIAVVTNPPRIRLFRETTSRWAAALGLSYADLLASLLPLLSKASVINKYLAVDIEEPPKPETGFDADWLALLTMLNEYLPELANLKTGNHSEEPETWLKTHHADLLSILQQHLSEPLQQSLLIRLKAANNENKLLAEFETWIIEHETELSPAILLRLAVFEQQFSSTKNATPAPLQTSQENRHKTNDLDELYIDNAGLVILWPFLNHFFQNLGLVQAGEFLNDASVQTGVALLQYLSCEDSDPSEHLLALNKLLCGMELEAVFHLKTPLTETERQECNAFLNAVIEQVPILNNMSVAGFRSSFLLRQGILSSRDGANLLQVERETYDIVLDRFPWSMDWIKLPWMSSALRVEW
jgi:hypothetical protein